MTIIFQRGDTFWIEHLEVIHPVDVQATYDVAVSLEKPGICLGWADTYALNNSSNLPAQCYVFADPVAFLDPGDFASSVISRLNVGAGGNNGAHHEIIMFMRGRKVRV